MTKIKRLAPRKKKNIIKNLLAKYINNNGKKRKKELNIKTGTSKRHTDARQEDAHPNNVPKKLSTAKYHHTAPGAAEPPGRPRLTGSSGDRREQNCHSLLVASLDGANHVGRRLGSFLQN